LSKIYVTATTNVTHNKTSRHYSAKAIDISWVNSKKMSVNYSFDASIKTIVDAMQVAAEESG